MTHTLPTRRRLSTTRLHNLLLGDVPLFSLWGMSPNSGPDYAMLGGSAALPSSIREGWPGGIHPDSYEGTGRNRKSGIPFSAQ